MYKQTDGSATRSPFDLALLNICVDYLEEKAFSKIQKFLVYSKQVDDAFATCSHVVE